MIHEKIEITTGEGISGFLYTYFMDNSIELYDGRKRPVVLIVPGGGYCMTSDREAEGIALKYLALGYHAAVLRYSVAPVTYPHALLQLAKAAAMLRKNSEKWYIDKNRLITIGFSAGGHLAACLGNFWNRSFLKELTLEEPADMKPDAQILAYPVISSGQYAHQDSFVNLLGERLEELKDWVSMEKQVNQDTPPTFLWHSFEDATVKVENSMLFAWALREHGIKSECHFYGKGSHGIGTAGPLSLSKDGRGMQKSCENWIELSHVWMDQVLKLEEVFLK